MRRNSNKRIQKTRTKLTKTKLQNSIKKVMSMINVVKKLKMNVTNKKRNLKRQ